MQSKISSAIACIGRECVGIRLSKYEAGQPPVLVTIARNATERMDVGKSP